MGAKCNVSTCWKAVATSHSIYSAVCFDACWDTTLQIPRKSHFPLLSRWTHCCITHYLGSEPLWFECSLNAVATIELKLILLSFNRKVMLAYGPQCHGLLDRGLDDICCIGSEVTDLTPTHPHPPSPTLTHPHLLDPAIMASIDVECSGLDKHFRLRTLSSCFIALYAVEFGFWGVWKMCILMFFSVTYNFGLLPSFWLVSVAFLILVLSC